MPPMTRRHTAISAFATAAVVALGGAACRPKVSGAQCDELLDRYAAMVVGEKLPDASAAQVKLEQEREKNEARADDSFKNCSSQVSRAEFDCALRAPTADAFEKCLE